MPLGKGGLDEVTKRPGILDLAHPRSGSSGAAIRSTQSSCRPPAVKWTDLDPKGAPGVQIADLWGDHAKGAFGAFLKLPAGFAAPLHTHTHAMKVVFLSGTYIQAPEGKSAVRLGPGSYMMQPGGNYRHTTSCDKARTACSSLKAKERLTSSRWRAETHPRVAQGISPQRRDGATDLLKSIRSVVASSR